ncbi:hypothetical protein GO730_00155 [Spirosoma sp. HMF3257]|uniref:Uncharacterized protein n=1 Tax=Spirosoma telluris TaxID=2183553 RepID=A0A327ND76_9BACT|nr:hypothetical protein [Spirosoma telluris]RAI73220.1 hypothetical protein HMF3257_00155 [Spirosoma telluris]
MKQFFIFLLLSLGLCNTSLFAQKKSTKVYIAEVSIPKVLPGPQLKRRNDEITFQAKNKINNLLDLFTTLTSNSLTESERSSVIQNSYLPNQNQIFYNDAVVVEDDIDPKHTTSENTSELAVDRYLRDMDLFYSKADTVSIKFTQIITSPVQDGKEYIYIKVFFTSVFNGRHTQFKIPYQPIHRIAELKAELVEGKWRTYITRLAFLRSGEGLTELSRPIIKNEFGPKKSLDSKPVSFLQDDNTSDSVMVKWDVQWLTIVKSTLEMIPVGSYQRSNSSTKALNSISITLAKDDQKLTFKRLDGTQIGFSQIIVKDPKINDPDIDDLEDINRLSRKYRIKGWGQIAAGLLALGVSYAGYTSLQTSYNDYTAKLSNINSEYAIWQTMTQQSGGGISTPMTFSEYARPGIYAVYGGGVVGSGLIINGIRHLLKAGRLKR